MVVSAHYDSDQSLSAYYLLSFLLTVSLTLKLSFLELQTFFGAIGFRDGFFVWFFFVLRVEFFFEN